MSKKLTGIFVSTEFQKKWCSFVIKDYLSVLKLSPVLRCFGWQGCMWIDAKPSKITKKIIIWLAPPDYLFDIFVIVLQEHFLYG